MSDFPRSFTAHIITKDPTHDRGFAFDDLKLTRFSRYRSITIGSSASVTPVSHDALHSAPNFVSEIGQKERAEKSAHPDLDLIRRSLMHGSQFDAQEIEPFPNPGEIFLVSRQAIQRFDQNDLEGAVPYGVEQAQQPIATIHRSAGARSIIIDADYLQFIAFRVISAYRHLVFDGTFVL